MRGVITTSERHGGLLESCLKLFKDPKTVSNWVMGELTRELNNSGTDIVVSPVSPDRLVDLLTMVDKGVIRQSRS